MTYKKDAKDKVVENIENGITFILTIMYYETILSQFYVAFVVFVANISIVV